LSTAYKKYKEMVESQEKSQKLKAKR